MGWTYEPEAKTPQFYIDLFTKPYESEDAGWHRSTSVIAHRYEANSDRRGVLYTVSETVSTNGTLSKKMRFIMVYILDICADGYWGYKAMDCCMGPFESECPVDCLDMCPPHAGREWCQNFHNRCRAYHERHSTLYADLLAAGIPMDSHESDLYFPQTPQTEAILNRWALNKSIATTFRHTGNGKLWYDVPFAYLPFWAKKGA